MSYRQNVLTSIDILTVKSDGSNCVELDEFELQETANFLKEYHSTKLYNSFKVYLKSIGKLPVSREHINLISNSFYLTKINKNIDNVDKKLLFFLEMFLKQQQPISRFLQVIPSEFKIQELIEGNKLPEGMSILSLMSILADREVSIINEYNASVSNYENHNELLVLDSEENAYYILNISDKRLEEIQSFEDKVNLYFNKNEGVTIGNSKTGKAFEISFVDEIEVLNPFDRR